MAKEKFPFLKHPQVKAEEEKLKEVLEAERLFFDYKVREEEVLSIFDEAREYLTYEQIISSSLFSNPELDKEIKIKEKQFISDKKEPPPRKVQIYTAERTTTIRQEIEKHYKEFKEADPKNNHKHPILFEDFIKLLEVNPEFFDENLDSPLEEFLYDSIYETELEKIKETASEGNDKKKKKKNEKSIKDQAELRAIGKTVRLTYLIRGPLQENLAELASYKDEEIKKIAIYAQAQKEPIREALRDINMIKDSIQISKSAATVEHIRKPSETATLYRMSEEKVKKINARLERLFRKKTGRDIKLGIVETYEKTGNIVDKDFITAYVNYYREMKYMHELLVKGKIVETGYVKDIIEEAMRVLKKNPPTIVYFHGDFGTGKTTLAIHIAKTRFGKEPIVVSGSKYLDPERFTEEFRIQKLGSVDFFNQIAKELGEEVSLKENASIEEIITALVGKKNDLREKIIENFLREDYIHSLGGKKFNEKEFKDYVDKNKNKIPEQKLKDLDEQLDNLFSNQVQGRYVLESMYICMKEGRPLIIDEANAISPDVLIAFNDLLTKKIGEKIKVRSDEKEIQIKEGYCIIWTGNTGERYKYARFNDMDPAAYSRIVPIKVEYLPQSREVNNMQQLMERLDLDNLSDKTFKNEEEILNFVKESKEKAGSDQIFQVLLLKLLNDRLGAELLVRKDDRYSIFKDLYRLSVGARIIMDMFEGRAENLPKFPNLEKIIGSNDPTVLMKKLKNSNLTMRDLIDNIIGGYLNEGQSMDIEYYAFKFVKKYNMYPEEQAILYAILQKTGMFSPQEGWPDYQKIKTGDQKEALTQFQKMINFDPVKKVKKYKEVNKNGDYVSLLDTNGEYEYNYISSLEALQLLFGYLPPRKKEEYENILKKQKESLKENEIDVKKKELLDSIKDAREALSARFFKTALEAEMFLIEIKKLKLSDAKFIENSSEEEFLAEVDKFNEMLLSVLLSSGNISKENLKKARAMDPESKIKFLRSLLKDIK